MKRTSKITRFTAFSLLGLYACAIFGFVAMSVTHSLEHVFAEISHSEVQASSQVAVAQEAGCKPAAGTSGSEVCPGCAKQQKGSAVMAKYYRVFDFRGVQAVAVTYFTQVDTYSNINSDLYDQTSFQPQTPPPKPIYS